MPVTPTHESRAKRLKSPTRRSSIELTKCRSRKKIRQNGLDWQQKIRKRQNTLLTFLQASMQSPCNPHSIFNLSIINNLVRCCIPPRRTNDRRNRDRNLMCRTTKNAERLGFSKAFDDFLRTISVDMWRTSRHYFSRRI